MLDQGLVKLADFGVATKLTEADIYTHSAVVGTPYWMAPEVIEMSGVSAASDIWSVGCTVIELLTCVPPYYDLQPMPALWRIVQDEHPPIPDHLSPEITDFLRQCFKKDARQRPDAKTLLLHPWIQNSRPTLQPSLRESSVPIRNIEEDVSMAAEVSYGDQRSGETPSGEKMKKDAFVFKLRQEDSMKELLEESAIGMGKSPKYQNSKGDFVCEHVELRVDVVSDPDTTLALYDRLPKRISPGRLPSTQEEASTNSTCTVELSSVGNWYETVVNGEVEYPESKKKNVITGEIEGKGSSVLENGSHNFGKISPGKAVKASICSGSNELSKFSDPPGDASLDDLFQPLDRNREDCVSGTSKSASSSHMNEGTSHGAGSNDLAAKLKARMAQKRLENGMGQANGGGLLRLMMGVLREDVIGIDNSLVFDEKLPGESLFPLQAVEFSRLVGSLKPEEPDDVIVSACQKLTAFFHVRPEQKIVYVTQHGLLPLMELLEIPKTRIICSVLQMINHIIKDNTDYLENACLIGLIPVVMSFAASDRPREVRMHAAYFLQQLCQSSSLTLQMFIACRGIPVLVSFLEADYAKYREMVHLAIDCMWQVFMLQHSTPRNDFCRIAAKNGILFRLINTLHSLNEAARLAFVSSASGSIPANGSAQRPRSVPLDFNHPVSAHCEMPPSGADLPDMLKFRNGITDHPSSLSGTLEPLLASTSQSQRSDINRSDAGYFPGDTDKPQSINVIMEASVQSPEPTGIENVGNRPIKDSTLKDFEHLDLQKSDQSWTEADLLRQQRINSAINRISIDKPLKQLENASNRAPTTSADQRDQVRPLLSLLEKEPPSKHLSGQLEYVRHFSGLGRHESILPLLHASTERKPNGELDFLMAEFAEVSGRGKEGCNIDRTPKLSHKTVTKKVGPPTPNEGAVSISGVASQTASGILSGSGVLNARPGSTTSSGLLSHMVSTLNTDVTKEYLEKVADLLLEFAQADTTVKSYMCGQSLLSRLFQMFNRIETPVLLKLLKCINHLSTDANCLENLQRADAIRHLIPNLELQEGLLISQIQHEVLKALFNLCKINKRRQEQAAESGIIPHLMRFIMSDSPLKQYALPLLCDMAHASRNSREQLRAHGGLDVYLSLLDNELWSVTALDSLAVCLAHDNDHRKVEQALLRKEAVHKLVKFFQGCPQQYFVHILEPFLKMITKSSRINTALAVNGLTPLLIARLDHQDAIARLNLLRLIKAVYEHHPRPKQLIVENDLHQKLQNLTEERREHSGGQVLVKQMATALLKALHINTVL
ncbi:MAP3K epsilon protein kinase 1-like isoform X2 [Macadamia integrifolia]|uniref:MAP3K epsilon protein kinase 1-like isoform X2 n=1 Tax=Macadamia integrifolia TaxID=60698 RepID=UPI001C4F96B2|nr:MAP3K epsilon protein kinase 1-like isoform X2 [Macadamia integrifolia]